MSSRIYPNSKEIVLEAATRLLLNQGSAGFTTDAVIQESGLSKAGFFYHFKTKSDLIKALGERSHAQWKDEIKELTKKDPNPIGRSIRSHVKSAISHLSGNSAHNVLSMRLLAEVMIDYPEVFESFLAKFGENLPLAKDEGLSREQIHVIYMALDGYWVQATTPYYKISTAQLKRSLDLLLKMTEVPLMLEAPEVKSKTRRRS